MKSLQELIEEYSRYYLFLYPSSQSVAFSSQLWDKWASQKVVKPNVEKIASEAPEWEAQFFLEVVRKAESLTGKKVRMAFVPCCLSSYNFHAITGRDGYLVLVDDVFLQLIFFLVLVIVFDGNGLIEEAQRPAIKKEVHNMLLKQFLAGEKFKFGPSHFVFTLLGQDYETAEYANYFFSAIRIFFYAHELGHHFLGHTQGPEMHHMISPENKKEISILVDKRAKMDELEADIFAQQILHALCYNNEKDFYYTQFKYDFKFTGIFIFSLFEKLDQWTGKLISENSATHPSHRHRMENLIQTFGQELVDEEFLTYKKGMEYFLSP